MVAVRPEATTKRAFNSADQAKAATVSGALIPLASLESRTDWNSQTDEDRINLQYAESYMAVRFMIETYGAQAGADVVREIGGRFNITSAIQNILGLPYSQFEQQFVAWLEGWDDPDRVAIRQYFLSLDGVLVALDSILERRSESINVGSTLTNAETLRRTLAADSTELLHRVEALSPPLSLDNLQQDALAFLRAVAHWLTLELQHAETGLNARLVEANAMIPEIDARKTTLNRQVNHVKFIYSLGE